MRVARRARRQWGVLSLAELLECGLSEDAVASRVAAGYLHRLHRGVYAVGHTNLPLEGLFIAAVKACGTGARLSHHSAGSAYGMLGWDGRYPQVTVPGSATRRHPGIRVHRTTTLDPRDVTWHRGIPITTPARTLVDLAGQLPYRALRRATRQALALKLVELRELIETMHRLGPRRGTSNLKRVVATAAPTRSVLEDVVLDLILRGNLAKPDVNVPMRAGGRVVVPDFRWPSRALIVEADSRTWHDDPLAREDDAQRQALLEASGERVIRVTWEQAVARPGQTLARIRNAGAPVE